MRRTAEERADFVAKRAEAMRRQPTPAERILRDLLKPLGFQFQVPIVATTKNGGRFDYILDAFHAEAKLVVEADGSAHRRQKGRDRRRDTRLATEGITTLRIANSRVLNPKHHPEILLQIKGLLDRDDTQESL